VTLHIK